MVTPYADSGLDEKGLEKLNRASITGAYVHVFPIRH